MIFFGAFCMLVLVAVVTGSVVCVLAAFMLLLGYLARELA